ncbi:hypothetical protein ACXZ9C_11350 [Streptococcus agalactiae]
MGGVGDVAGVAGGWASRAWLRRGGVAAQRRVAWRRAWRMASRVASHRRSR